MRRALVAIALLALAGASALAAQHAARPPVRDARHGVSRSDAGAAAPVPVWSIRRVPELLARFIAQRHLDADLDRALAGTHACLVARTGDVNLITRDASVPLAAASSQKLLIAAAALRVLGPDFRFETKLVARDDPRDGAVGDVWLIGDGDPLLTTPEYQAFLATQKLPRDRPVTPVAALLDNLAATGVHAIHGAVHGDDSRYDRLRYLPTWKPVYLTDHEIGPLGALTVNDGFVTWKPKINSAADPAVYAASEVRRLAVAHGIAVDGGADAGPAPARAKTVARVRSAPLRDVVADMLRESNNLTAELLVRELGGRVGHDASTAGGLAVIGGELAQLDLPVDGLHLVDGSGLDTGNRVTCRLLFAALDLGARAEYRALWDGLAVAGRSGTLINRLMGTPLEAKLRAKTGSIDGVVGLTGFVDGARGIQFAFVADGSFGDRAGRVLQDSVALALLRWPDAPDPDSMGPS
jgi:D-alanyl-D-alanine carboxypeptidase/D-alanyl-D-alanine-endopeptidase (penicillin-binding protein 4)